MAPAEAGGHLDAAAKKSTIRRLHIHMLVRVFQSCQNIQGEPQIALDLCRGDVSSAMRLLAATTTVGGLVQFLANPTLGGASDTFGRKVRPEHQRTPERSQRCLHLRRIGTDQLRCAAALRCPMPLQNFLRIGPFFNIISNSCIALFPSNYWMFVVFRTLDDAFTTLSGSTTTSAAISDCAKGPELAIAMSQMG